jgi:hypothetical protein
MQLTFRRNLVRHPIGTFTSRSVQAGREFCPSELHSLSFSILYKKKISDRAKVCALCTEKNEKAQSGRGKQTTYNCNSVIFHYAVWGNFGIPQAAECGCAKLGEQVITCINLLRMRLKKSYSVLF